MALAALVLIPGTALAQQAPPPCDAADPPSFCEEAEPVLEVVRGPLGSAEEIVEDVTRPKTCDAVAQATGYLDAGGRIDAEGGGSCPIGDADDVNERDVQGAVLVTGTHSGSNTCYDQNGACVAVVASYATSVGAGGNVIGCIRPVYASPFPIADCTTTPYVILIA